MKDARCRVGGESSAAARRRQRFDEILEWLFADGCYTVNSFTEIRAEQGLGNVR
jgi:hypothetical protein